MSQPPRTPRGARHPVVRAARRSHPPSRVCRRTAAGTRVGRGERRGGGAGSSREDGGRGHDANPTRSPTTPPVVRPLRVSARGWPATPRGRHAGAPVPHGGRGGARGGTTGRGGSAGGAQGPPPRRVARGPRQPPAACAGGRLRGRVSGRATSGERQSRRRGRPRGAPRKKKNPAATKNKRAPVPTRTTRWRCWQRPLAGARAPHDGHDGGFGTGGWGGHRPRRKAPPAAPFARGPTQPHDRCYRPAAEKTCSGGGKSWAAPKSASGTAAMPAPSHHHDLPAQNLNDAMATLTVRRWRSQRPHAGARAPRCRHGGGYGLSGWGTTAEKPTRGARRAVRRPARRAKGLLLPAGGLRGTEFGETSAGGAGCGRLNCHRGQEDLCWAVGDGRAPRNWAALVRRADITGAAEPVVKTPGCNRQIETAAGLVG